ncbi:MAG: type II secretion system protein [Candidatus Gastranaerophilaceae bacterium]
MKKAMTIGELLVTMSIIGIIATLVLPGFLKDYHNKLYVAHLKKVYEMLDSAVNQACSDNNVSYFYQTPYSLYSEDGANQQAFIDKYFKKSTRAVASPFSKTYKLIGVSKTLSGNLAKSHGWGKLVGGEAVSFYCNAGTTYCLMRVDINSTDGPNIAGRDYFALFVDKRTNKIYDQAPATNCGIEVASLATIGCFGRIMQDNWEMKY